MSTTLPNAIITAYCGCALCCGTAGNPTASGRMPQAGFTIAAPRVVPFGTWVTISLPGRPPIRRRVDDRTARRFDGRWDIYFSSHREALEFGKQRGYVTINKKGTK